MTDFLDKLPFAKQPWFRYLRLLVWRFIDDNCTQKAASLTYTTLLSIVPMLAVVLVIFSTVPALAPMREQIQLVIYKNLLPSSGLQVSQYIDSFTQNSARLTVIGVGVLLFTTIMTLITIETAFNQIWKSNSQETGIKDGLKSILRHSLMVIATPIILAIAFIASSAIKSLDFFNQKIAGYGIDWAVWGQLLSIAMTMAGFVALYWLMPKAKVPFKNALIAGISITVIFECTKQLFGLVIKNFTSYEAVYGAFAVLPVFLLWIYLSWNLILLGVEISYTLTIFKQKPSPKDTQLQLSQLLNHIYIRYEENKPTDDASLKYLLTPDHQPHYQAYIKTLIDGHFIQKTQTHHYKPTNELMQLPLIEIHQRLKNKI